MADPKRLYDWIKTDLVTDPLDGTEQIHVAGSTESGKTTTGAIAALVDLSGLAPALTADENYVTDAEKLALHAHSNKSALDLVSGVNTGDQNLTGLVHANRAALDLVSGTNTGDQDLSGLSPTSHRHAGETVGAVQSITFDTTPLTPALSPGEMRYNETEHTIEFLTGQGTTLQINKEIIVDGLNKLGIPLTDGVLASLNGVQGNRVLIEKLDITNGNIDQFVGMVTAPIADNATGPICEMGLVHGLNTSVLAGAEGSIVWATATPGEYSTTAPTTGRKVRVGILTKKHVSDGHILVLPKVYDLTVEQQAALDGAAAPSAANPLATIADIPEDLSAGVYTAPTVTNNNGTITVSSGVYALYSTPDASGRIRKYTVAGGVFVLTDETYNYLVCKYNGGTPIVTVITNLDEITDYDVIPIDSIFRTGTFIHPTDWGEPAKGLPNKINRFLRRTKRFTIESGLTLSSFGTRQIDTSSGIVWTAGSNPIPVGAARQGTNTTFFNYHVAGVWTRDTATTQYPNTQYDDGTNLVALNPGRYAVIWVYRGVEQNNHIYYTLGTGNYTLAQAQASLEPAKPTIVSSHTVLTGRIIIQNGSDTPTQIDLVSNTAFATEGVNSHTDLINRDSADQHPITAITGLQPALTSLNANSHAAGSDAETVASLGTLINGTGGITTPADVDKFPMRDSASGLLAHITWANIKAAFNSIFVPKTVSGALTENTFDINTDDLRMFSRALAGSEYAQVRASSSSASLHAVNNFDRLFSDIYAHSGAARLLAQKLTAGESVLTQSLLECKADGTTVLQLIDNSGTPATVTVVFSQTGVTFNGVRLVTAGDSLVNELRTDLTPTNGSTVTLDLSLGRTFKINATSLAAGNTFTIAVSNIPAGAVVTGVSVILQTGANVPTVTWPAGTTAPTLAASKTLWGTLATENNGTAWRWFKAGEFS